MNWGLDCAHPASAHVDPVHVSTDHPLASTILPLRSKDKCRSQSLAVAETTRCDEWDLQLLSAPSKEDHRCNIIYSVSWAQFTKISIELECTYIRLRDQHCDNTLILVAVPNAPVGRELYHSILYALLASKHLSRLRLRNSPVNGDAVYPLCLRFQGMPKRHAFMDDDTTVALEVLENRLRVSGGLDDLDALLNGSLSIG